VPNDGYECSLCRDILSFFSVAYPNACAILAQQGEHVLPVRHNPMIAGKQRVRDDGDSAEVVKRVRRLLGTTQAELADALSLSAKAIQSYEQGWRRVPVRVMRELLVLLALNQGNGSKPAPCWKVRQCPSTVREHCPSCTIAHGQFCWFVAAKQSVARNPDARRDGLPCLNCPVVSRLFDPKQERGHLSV